MRIHIPRTVQFDPSLPFTEINGYKFHTEIVGDRNKPPLIVVHGGPGQGYDYMYALKDLSEEHRVIFFDQRGAGLSPRVNKQYLTIDQNVEDLGQIVKHFSNDVKVKLIGHSWGGLLVVGHLLKQPATVSHAVLVEPTFLYPGAPVQEWVKKFKKEFLSIWKIARYVFAYPLVTKEDGHEGYDYIATRLANEGRPGPPYNCKDQSTPRNMFKRLGYRAYQNIFQPIIKNPDSFNYHFVDGIDKFQGELMLISTECSILGHKFQEKYNLPKLPSRTIHVKASNTGHNVLTVNPQWSVETIRKFLKRET